MRTLISFALVFFSRVAMAAEASAEGVPGHTIFWQAFNLAILFGGLFYYLRKPIKDYFRQRQSEFIEAAKKAQSARLEAEKEYLDIQHKIEHLEGSRAESLARAQAEAAEMRKQMVRDAEELAARIRQEAEATVRIEVQRAQNQLQERFVQEAVAAARTVLTKDISPQDQSKLQNDFAKNLQVGNP